MTYKRQRKRYLWLDCSRPLPSRLHPSSQSIMCHPALVKPTGCTGVGALCEHQGPLMGPARFCWVVTVHWNIKLSIVTSRWVVDISKQVTRTVKVSKMTGVTAEARKHYHTWWGTGIGNSTRWVLRRNRKTSIGGAKVTRAQVDWSRYEQQCDPKNVGMALPMTASLQVSLLGSISPVASLLTVVTV